MIDESETDADGRARINSCPADRGYEHHGLSPGRTAIPRGQRACRLAQGRARADHQHQPYREAFWSTARSPRRAPASRSRGPWSISSFATAGRTRIRSCPSIPHSDGSFRLGAEPAPGYLFVWGPDDDYVLQAIGSRMVRRRPAGRRADLLARLRRARPETGHGQPGSEPGPPPRRDGERPGRRAGRPARPGCLDLQPAHPRPESARQRGSWTGSYHGKVRNGRFAIRGLAPDAEVPVYFLEPERKLGAVVNLSAKSAAGGPVTVRLEPCGAARAWLVDPDGKPVAKPVRKLIITMVVTPGPAQQLLANDKAASLLSADEGDLTVVDPINYETALAPDALGRITLPVLIPGATYRFIDYTTYVRGQTGPEIRKEFTVKPGEKLDLGDIRIAKPST